MFWFMDTPSLLTYLVTTQSCPNIICLCLFHGQLCMILFVHGVMVSSPCVLSNKYPLFALPSYCCVSSFYQVFLLYNPKNSPARKNLSFICIDCRITFSSLASYMCPSCYQVWLNWVKLNWNKISKSCR